MSLPTAPSLPIDAVLPELVAALARTEKAVLVAAPGAGKTTRVPLALLAAPWRGDGTILLVEPRRIAARAAARRMAETLGERVGERVGYRVRLDAEVSEATRIEVVTEGLFTRRILDDPELAGVAAVIFDEFHERSLDGDFGLALALEAAAALRPELRILVMSATIDGARVARLLGDAPVISSEGRAFPVETRHVARDPALKLEDQVAAVILRALGEDPGSVLAFLPGQAEIRRTAERLGSRLPADTEIAPLYGALTAAEQDRAIRPAAPGRRKVVLATSIAETSLTIEGVRIVVDAGYARGPKYEPATGLTRLETTRVSRAGADQRRGRAGRTEPGVCWRLWAEAQTGALAAFDRPEILEADLAGFALDLAVWGSADAGGLAFLDPPPAAAFTEARALLADLGALDADGRVTAAGRRLARLPLHPRLAHMVVAAGPEGDGRLAAEIAVLVSEHGLGGDGTDLADRLRRFRAERGPRADDARALVRRFARLAGGDGSGAGAGDEARLGRHLARAYPDRVAQARGRRGEFRLANGRGGALPETSPLAGSAFLVVADLTGPAQASRIRLGAAIEAAEVEALFGTRIRREETLRFDAAARAVRARVVRRLGALVLSEEPLAEPDPGAVAALLVREAAARGLDRLPWTKEQRALRARATFLAATIGGDWPDLSESVLAATAEDWLAPQIHGKARLDAIDADDLGRALDGLLPWARRREMEALLPSHFDAPSGSRLPIDYGAENGPALEIRVQELFGLDRHPSVAGGKLPLLLVLLSPAHRPIQTTRDLPGFWRGSWKDVAKDLKGRYPKHPWPDDPLAAPATSRAKPRGTS
ncbi:ATP-dependent helicase HrpB [Methylobrevis albus]|uniref:ATP-dependent helicase HrpB n=1 Tax=Methylobrevis albus TaxID=2793297 RepID=A0A931I2G3_9HYPH|nr:ATP-dependent helicase HrpB [Methylobrevis albus]MBH0238602.1 ATP-dependent helicase HrpB [Methylobrevis albus]